MIGHLASLCWPRIKRLMAVFVVCIALFMILVFSASIYLRVLVDRGDLQRWLQPYLPHALSYRQIQVQRSFFGTRLQLDGVTYADAGVRIRMPRVQVKMDWWGSLLHWHLDVELSNTAGVFLSFAHQDDMIRLAAESLEMRVPMSIDWSLPVTVRLHNLRLLPNRYFRLGWPQMNMRLLVSRKGAKLMLHQVVLSHPWLTWRGKGSLEMADASHLRDYILDWHSNFQIKDAQSVIRYYVDSPFVIPKLSHWLRQNIVKAKRTRGVLNWRGRIGDYPYTDRSGDFLVDMNIDQGQIVPWQGWPSMVDLSVNLQIHNQHFSMKKRAHTGVIKTAGVNITSASVDVPDIMPGHASDLVIRLTGQSEASQAAMFILESPLYKKMRWLDRLRFAGSVHADVVLSYGLSHPRDVISGQVRFMNTDLALNAYPVSVTQLNGQLHFKDAAIYTDEPIAGYYDGHAVDLAMASHLAESGHMQQDLTIHTLLDTAAWAEQFNLPKGLVVSGELPIKLDMHLQNEALSFETNVDLSPISFDLLGVYQKPVGVAEALYASFDMTGSTMRWDMILGDQIKLVDVSDQYRHHIDLTSPLLQGKLIWDSRTGGVDANMTRVIVPKVSGDDITSHHVKLADLTTFPLKSLKLVIQDFQYGKTSFGRVSALLLLASQGITMDSFMLMGDGYQVNLTGDWSQINDREQVALAGDITGSNWAGVLSRLDMAPFLSADSGRLKYTLSWPGGPLSMTLGSLRGRVNFAFKDGQLTDVNPGVARILGLLSIESLSRRFRLDFDDVTHKGLVFDQFTGDIALANGLAKTERVDLYGPALDVNMVGTVDMLGKTLDQRLHLVPHLSGSMAVMAGLVGGPIAAAVTWATDKVLGKTLFNDETLSYRLYGPWHDTKFESVTRPVH